MAIAGGWARCVDGYPSTHIAKLAHPAGSPAADIVHTEVACTDLARVIGLTSITAELALFGGQFAIVVSRYDRISCAGVIRRIHQEDTAQALGINTSDPDRKFQHGKQLPSLAKIATVLRNGGTEPDQLLRLTTFNLAIGNTDAHAKNISLLRHPDGSATLAPAYDVAMHLHHPGANRMFAMDINGKSSIDDIGIADLIDEATAWPLPRNRAINAVGQTVAQLLRALDSVNVAAYPGVPDQAWDVVGERTRQLLADVPPLAPTSAARARQPSASKQPRVPKGKPGGGRFAG